MTQEFPGDSSWNSRRAARHQWRDERRRLRRERHNAPRAYSGGLAWGLVLMIGGGLLLMNNFDMLQFRVWQIWPLALLVSGIVVVVRARRSGEALFGVITAAVGGFFLLVVDGVADPGRHGMVLAGPVHRRGRDDAGESLPGVRSGPECGLLGRSQP